MIPITQCDIENTLRKLYSQYAVEYGSTNDPLSSSFTFLSFTSDNLYAYLSTTHAKLSSSSYFLSSTNKCIS